MRLVRLGQQPSRVAEDIRAALVSLGRGDHVVGGIALIGPRPLPTAKPVDAVMLLPRGVIIVVGVDLPDPAMRLEAPLTGQWKADGWPLVGPGSAANPAVGALTLVSSIERHLREQVPQSPPIGTIVAVGPFVEKVDQPPAEAAGNTRVLHPTPTSMLAATVSLAAGNTVCTVAQARALLRILAPEAEPLDTELLSAEGFAAESIAADAMATTESMAANAAATTESAAANNTVAESPAGNAPAGNAAAGNAAAGNAAASTREPTTDAVDPSSAVTVKMPAASPAATKPPRKSPSADRLPPLVPEAGPAAPARPAPAATPAVAPLPKPIEVTAPVPKLPTPLVAERHSHAVRWLPVAAIGLLAVMLVTAIVLATTHTTDSPSPPPRAAAPRAQTSQGFQFIERASGTEQRCADHAYGDLQASLQSAPCTMMRRGSFETSADGKPIAVSIAVVYFGDEKTAAAFKTAADTPGGGGVTDLATETRKWPRTPQFAGAAYASAITGAAVRLVLAAWFDGSSSASDPELVQVAHVGLSVEIS